MRKRDQFRPFAVKVQLDLKDDNAMIEIEQACIHRFARRQVKRIRGLDDRSLFKAHIRGRGDAEAGGTDWRFGTQQCTQFR